MSDFARKSATRAVIVGTLLLLIPAFWNGYAIFYFDSLDYISYPFTWDIPIFRTAGYGLFAVVGRPLASVWVIVAAQSALLAYVLIEARRILFAHLSDAASIVIFAVLLIFTGMPWIASTAMPDVFTVPSVLLCIMLAQREVALSVPRRAVFILFLGIACAAHPTHIALCTGLIVCLFVADKLAMRGWPFTRQRIRDAVGGILLGVLVTIAANWVATGKIFLTPRTTPVLTLAVLIQKGMVQEYLAETCDDPAARKSILCPHRDKLHYTANEFLWHNQFFNDIGGWPTMMAEAPWMLDAIIGRRPFEFVLTAAELMGEQIVKFRTGEGFRTMVGFLDREIRTYYPHDNPAFIAARQQSYPEIGFSPMGLINDVQLPVMLASLPLMIWVLVLAWRRRDAASLSVGGLVTLAYLGNAFICGAISNPADRYGNRIVWLVTFTALALLAKLLRKPLAQSDGRETSSAAG